MWPKERGFKVKFTRAINALDSEAWTHLKESGGKGRAPPAGRDCIDSCYSWKERGYLHAAWGDCNTLKGRKKENWRIQGGHWRSCSTLHSSSGGTSRNLFASGHIGDIPGPPRNTHTEPPVKRQDMRDEMWKIRPYEYYYTHWMNFYKHKALSSGPDI